MPDTVFRTAPEISQDTSVTEFKENHQGAEYDLTSHEPVEGEQAQESVLEALGIDDMVQNLPDESKSNLTEVSQYVLDLLGKKGTTATRGTVQSTLDSLKEEMGLGEDSDPETVLDRIGGVLKAWKNLTFISDPKEKRSLFMKLARQPSSKEMNRLVFKEMEAYQVWQ